MTPPRKILVPVDFSDPSRAALDYAADLAKKFDATLDVLHVWEAPVFFPPLGIADSVVADLSLVDVVKKSAEQGVEQFVAEAKKRGISVHEARTEPGPAAHTIVEIAKSGGYDLIVIGTHGRTGLSHALIGSVAERVVRHASCPVLSVRVTA